ncbi:hypothetical protein ACKAV7_011956 [Fusarium commune]
MASSTTNPPVAPDPFDLGIHTPANLNRGARAALLQNSPAAVNGTIGVSPGPRRMAQTPSSPLSAATIAAATEGAARGNPPSTFEQQPVSIVESANDLAQERIEEYNAKLMFADSFLDSWKRELSSAGPTIPKPTYSSVAAASPPTDRGRLTHRQQQQHGRRQTDPPHRQGQPRTIAPPRQDLRVFIRLEAGAPARAHSSYAIRTLIQEKVGAVSDKIRQVFQALIKPTFISAQLGQREYTACSADSPKNNEDTSGPLARRHTDNDTWHNNQSRIWKPNKATTSHYTNSRAFVVQVQRHQEHPRANIGKIPLAYDCALALADSERYDIILLQEPWTAYTDTCSLTKTHPTYDTFTPVETWDGNDTRPRVMTYVRRDPRLLANQIRPFQTRDILWLTINGITIVNFYHQNNESDAMNILIRWPVPERCLIAGDYWASENDLDLLNTPDIPTNPHGNTINLAFTNMPLAEATVEDHLATSSDHFTLSLTLPDAGLAPMQPGRVRVTTDDELKRFAEIVELGAAGLPTADSTPSELDELASALVNLLTSAAKAAGRPTRKGARTAPWWTEECAGAAASFRAIRRLYPLGFNQDVQIAKRDFHRVTRRAKRLYWRNLIDSFTDSSAVFKAVRWLKSPGPFQPPPLQVGDVVYETQLDKANALRRATLERRTADDDIENPWIPVSFPRSIPFPLEISLDEAHVLHPQQAGALPKRSATDLVTALIYDIEEAFARKKVATLVTMDIQGAFDTVMRNRPVLRLREQGWPDHLARWAGSFMSGRLARVRYQDTLTSSSPLECGLPQGSPISPILFLLYTEPIYRLGNPQGRFGYADDTAILSIGDTVDETTAMASGAIDEMVRWGATNGVSFDSKKTEVMHFSRSKLRAAPAVHHGDIEKHPESALRWLGIWLDSRLLFRIHVEKWAAKAQAVAYHLRGLTNTKHGPLPAAVRSAVRACIKPVLLHGSETWYLGISRPRWNQPTKDLPSSNQHLIQRITKAMNQAMRAILPVWKTKPIAALHRDSGIPPVAQLLEARRLRFSARLKSLDEAHPLASRTRPPSQPAYHDLIKRRYQAQTESSFRTRLRRTDELLAPCARPKLIEQRFNQEQMPLLLPVLHGSGRLGPAEVFDAEATGALQGLKAALNLQESVSRNIIICLDNLAAATCLRGTPSDSSQDVFLKFQALAALHKATQVRWVPGHTDIPGNEQADKLAKAASSLPEPEGAQPTLAYLRKVARQKPKEAFET